MSGPATSAHRHDRIVSGTRGTSWRRQIGLICAPQLTSAERPLAVQNGGSRAWEMSPLVMAAVPVIRLAADRPGGRCRTNLYRYLAAPAT
jgi:hypothetical protein